MARATALAVLGFRQLSDRPTQQETPPNLAIPQNPQFVGAKHSGNNLSDLPKIDYPNASPFRPDNITLQTASKAPLVEAQGWVINPQGQVVLIASGATVTPHLPWHPPTSCPSPLTN